MMAPIDFEKRVTSRSAIREHMDIIKRKILVMSGKGGVGKTTVTVGLAQALAAMGLDTGILDADLHGPNVAKMLQSNQKSHLGKQADGSVSSIKISPHLSIAGVDATMEDSETARVWQEPMKSMVITDLLARVSWGPLECLLIDTPPGSGEEHLTICKHIPELTGAIIVTTPQEVSILDAVRSIVFCRKMGIAILGVVENMSSLSCPSCEENITVFGSQGGASIARKTGTPFLGSIPLKVQGEDGTKTEDALSSIARLLQESMTCSTTAGA